MKEYIIYIDGGSRRNIDKARKRYKRLGGCGILILDKNYNILLEKSIGFSNATSTRMEIMSAIIALTNVEQNCSITFFSDSLTLVEAKNNKYVPKTNLDLWKKLESLEKNKIIKYVFVKGHSGNEFNEICDKLATNAMQNDLLKEKEYLKSI